MAATQAAERGGPPQAPAGYPGTRAPGNPGRRAPRGDRARFLSDALPPRQATLCAMELRSLGATGVRVASLALGAMNFGTATPRDEAVRIVHRALDAGVNLIDTADVYGDGASERVVGEALRDGRRDRVVLATKGHFPTSPDVNDRGNSRRHLLRAVEASLARLSTDRIDLYQVHRPDPDVPLDETLRALDDLVRQGKIVYVGCSTFPAWQVMEGLAISERRGFVRWVSEQPPYNLLDRRIENELVPLARCHRLALLPWSPLAMGMLAGRYERADAPPAGSRVARLGGVYRERVTEPALAAARAIAAVAADAGLAPATLALAWVRQQPAVTAPIVGPRTEQHLEQALAAAAVTLPADVLQRLDAIVTPGTAVADFRNNRGVRSRD